MTVIYAFLSSLSEIYEGCEWGSQQDYISCCDNSLASLYVHFCSTTEKHSRLRYGRPGFSDSGLQGSQVRIEDARLQILLCLSIGCSARLQG